MRAKRPNRCVPSPPSGARPLRILRVIARLNIGGPAIQAITLTHRMSSVGYQTTLVRGVEGPREGALDDLAAALGVRPRRVRWLRRELGPWDALAFLSIRRLLRASRPDIVHTHAAKAGALGRLVALTIHPRRPLTVHTFHGHVLEGYFSGRKARLFRFIERWLARQTTCLIAVSPEVRADLLRMRIASPEKVRIVPLGFDLERFQCGDAERRARRASFRATAGISDSVTLVTLVARLVPIKRVDRFLEIAALLVNEPQLHFLIVGDGELREDLIASPAAERLGARLTWAGFTNRIENVCFASDMVVLTSDNEGTPVSLIEAQAAATPVVSTDVGGVRAVVRPGLSGFVVASTDHRGFAAAISTLAADEHQARRFGQAGREHVTATFTLDRLVADLDHLYRELLERDTG